MCDTMTDLYNDAQTTPPKAAERCELCRFWKPIGKRLPRGYSHPGRCRRCPPAMGRFPEMGGDEWCGEFRPR